MLRRTVLWLVAAVILGGVRGANADDLAKPQFAPGQVWSIKSSPPTAMKAIIGRVDMWNGKVAIHVSLIDVPIPSGMPGEGQMTQVDHAPFEQSAFAASVNQLLAAGSPSLPGFESGYKEWQSERGGIYTISVTEAVAAMFETLRQQDKKQQGDEHLREKGSE